MHKAKEISHLLFGNGLSCNRVINHNPGKFKLEWILHKDIIVNRHLECRANLDVAITISTRMTEKEEIDKELGADEDYPKMPCFAGHSEIMIKLLFACQPGKL